MSWFDLKLTSLTAGLQCQNFNVLEFDQNTLSFEVTLCISVMPMSEAYILSSDTRLNAVPHIDGLAQQVCID